jgi:hypothetical protein
VLHLAFVTGTVVVAVTAAWFAATHIGLDAPGSDGRGRRYDDGDIVAVFVLPLAIAWLLAMPLLKLRLTSGRWTGPYPSLFDITWRGALTLAEAALFGLIVIAFALALLPKLPALFAEGQKVMEAGWLLWLVAVTVLLLNAAYQSGQEPPGYGRIIEQTLRVVPPLLVVIALTALYSLAVRTSAYGLTPTRYWGLVTAAVATAYAVGYSIAAWAPGKWFARMGAINLVMALALLAVLLASLTPLADPLRLSVDSQARRALSPADDKAQDAALRFLGREAGASGRARLDRIAGLSDAEGGSAALRAAAVTAQQPTDPRSDDFDAWLSRIERQPVAEPMAALEPSLQTALRTARDKDAILGAVRRMMLLRTDLDADGVADALLVDDAVDHYWLFKFGPDDGWTLHSSGRLLDSGSDADIRAALRRGDFGALPPQTQDLRVGDRRLKLWPAETSQATAQD